MAEEADEVTAVPSRLTSIREECGQQVPGGSGAHKPCGKAPSLAKRRTAADLRELEDVTGPNGDLLEAPGAEIAEELVGLVQRQRLLRDISAGKHLTTLAFSERGSRSQFWAPVSRLREDGNGGFVTTASKSWVTAANHADSYVSSAQKPDAASPNSMESSRRCRRG